MLDVLIYVADGELLEGLDYATRIEERFTAAGLTTARCDLTNPSFEPPPPARSYVFTGGETSVHSDVPWMRAAVETMRILALNADREGYSVVAICLGSQILAEALHPDAITSSSAIEVGLTPVRKPHSEHVELIVPSFHYQAITPGIRSVPGVTIEWGNEHTEVQAFSFGKQVFGCQFHPELSSSDVLMLIDFHKDLISRWGGDVVSARRSVEQHADRFSADLFHQVVIDRIVG